MQADEVGKVIRRWFVERLRSLLGSRRIRRGSTAGDPAGVENPRRIRALRRAERELLAEKQREIAYAFGPDGGLLFRAEGGPEQVSFTADQCATLHGATLIHNHPSGGSFSLRGDPRPAGARGDIEFAAVHRLARILVVGIDPLGRQWRYSMRPPPARWSEAVWEELIRPAMDRAERLEIERLLLRLRSGSAVPPPDPEWAHRVWTSVAAETGVQYTRERIR